MNDSPGRQRVAVLREFMDAMEDGAFELAVRIFVCNPDCISDDMGDKAFRAAGRFAS